MEDRDQEYVLGADPVELDRLRHQHQVWRPHSEAVFDRLALGPGARVLDAGCGPGLVLADLRARVGPTGEAWGVDLTESLLEVARAEAEQRDWSNVHLVRGDLTEVELPADHFDLIWLRWVLSFPPDPGAILSRLAPSLKPGGALVVQDYHHDGVALFPRSAGFEAAIRATRQLYLDAGGDPWIAGRLPRLLRAVGLRVEDERADARLGGPDSEVFSWADRFFPDWVDRYHAKGLMSEEERAGFHADWRARREDPDMRFFAPVVVTTVARRP